MSQFDGRLVRTHAACLPRIAVIMDTVVLQRWIAPLALALSAAGTADGQVCPSPGDCLTTHGTPGCDHADCCTEVCGFMPACCSVMWDQGCVALAQENCGICGNPAAGSCLEEHLTAACDDVDCCTAICAIDPSCCQIRWDGLCALYAGFTCTFDPGICGDPDAGSCFSVHTGGACADVTCCEAVCAQDPSCCQSSWDNICVALAGVNCAGTCTVSPPPGALAESELCGDLTNDVCDASPGTPQALACGQSVSGMLGVIEPGTLDADSYLILLADTDGDGLVRARLRLMSEVQSHALLLPIDTCAPMAALLRVDSPGCAGTEASACVPTGAYIIRVAPGVAANPATASPECPADARYALTALCEEPCDPPPGGCPGIGSCIEQHASPGCADVECCALVCASDPVCCQSKWDGLCVASAAALCGYLPPLNDSCATPQEMTVGNIQITTLLASPTNPPLGITCVGTSPGADVWFKISGLSGTLLLSTCPTADFDSAIAVYTGDCAAPTEVACNSQAPCVGTFWSAAVSFAADCDTTYLVRVTANGTTTGVGWLSLSTDSSSPCAVCTGDIDGSGAVDGSDLATLVSQYGGPGSADLDGDGSVTGSDLSAMLAGWGACP